MYIHLKSKLSIITSTFRQSKFLFFTSTHISLNKYLLIFCFNFQNVNQVSIDIRYLHDINFIEIDFHFLDLLYLIRWFLYFGYCIRILYMQGYKLCGRLLMNLWRMDRILQSGQKLWMMMSSIDWRLEVGLSSGW